MVKRGKLLKFLNRPFVKGLVKSIPIVGDVADNVLTETQGSPAGEMDQGDMVTKIIRLVALLALAYFVLKGEISMDAAQDAKDLIDA